MLNEHYRDIAKKMIQSGATRGMVLQRLKKEGVSEELVNRAFEDAETAILLKKRAQGMAQMIAGGIVIADAGYLMFVVQLIGRPPFMIAVAGAILSFYGLSNMLQQRTSPKKKSRLK